MSCTFAANLEDKLGLDSGDSVLFFLTGPWKASADSFLGLSLLTKVSSASFLFLLGVRWVLVSLEAKKSVASIAFNFGAFSSLDAGLLDFFVTGAFVSPSLSESEITAGRFFFLP